MTRAEARWKGVALLGLLLLSALPPLLPAATADSGVGAPSPSLCFDRDAPAPGTPSANDPVNPQDPAPVPPAPSGRQCPGGVPDAPNYYEGQSVYIRLYNLPTPPAGVQAPPAYVRIRCLDHCHETDGTDYYAQWTGSTDHPLRFPDDFHQSGPNGEAGGNAFLDRAPRYNGTWQATMFYSGTEQLSRSFNVWIFDLFTSVNATVMPGESHVFRAAGFEDSASLEFHIERLGSDGKFVESPSTPTCARELLAQSGTFRTYDFLCAWNVPKQEAGPISECPATAHSLCYRVRVLATGTTKSNETIEFKAAPADIQISFLAGQYANPDASGAPRSQQLERTDVASVALDLHYPGGRLRQGPSFSPLDLVPTTETDRSLLVRVTRTNATSSANNGPVEVGQIRLRFVQDHFRWETNWTVPRDLDLNDPTATFRLYLAQTRDRFGNRIPETLFGNYTVTGARLQPVVVSELTTLERTADAAVRLDIRYHNGSVFGDQENASMLRGCYVRDPGQGQNPVCTNATSNAVGSYENHTWVFHFRFARDETTLGAYRFVLIGGASQTNDRWGNSINRTDSPSFDLTPASPRIAFATTMRGRDTTTLERGESIGLQAIITYPDGSPFNHTVRFAPQSADALYLNVTLTRRGADDAVQSNEILRFREYDTERGIWAVGLPISLDDSTSPAGRWTFAFYVNDTAVPLANTNRTEIDRTIVPAPLRFEPMLVTNTQPQTGSTMAFSFRVMYRDGTAIPPDLVRNSLLVQVYRFDTKNRTAVGDPVSSFLQPEWSSQYQWWTIQYVVPGHLYNGSFVFVVSGHDPSGNLVPQDAYSRTFSPQSLVLSRGVITQPPLQVTRGDAATVVFAAQDGDVGVDGTAAPVIRVERYDPDADSWNVVSNGTDVRQADPEIRDHFGVYPVTTTTAIGTYHFVLYGRNAAPSFAIITNASANFTVLPTDVSRDILTIPPEQIVKGDLVEFNIERLAGDRITNVVLRLNGRDTTLVRPLITDAIDHLNVSWRVPFDAPSGNYTLHIDGRDQFGNNIHIDSPTFEATAAQLNGKVIGNPPHVITRGTPATLLFGVTYPSGVFYTATDTPSAFVYNDSGLVATAIVQREGVTFQATWTPPIDAQTGQYWFEVSGSGRGGNTFPPLRSSSFELAPGGFDRKPEAQLGTSYERFATVGLVVPYVEGDRSVTFELQYFGPLTDLTDVDHKQPVSRTTLPHQIDVNVSRYYAHFVTDQQTPLGLYRITMKGTDGLGNVISTATGGFILHNTLILSSFEQQPPQTDFKENGKLTLTFSTRYKNGPIMDDSLGHPSVAFLLGGTPVTQKPEIVYDRGHWIVTWTAPANLLPGEYNFAIGGVDAFGNTISSQKSNSLLWNPPLSSSFAKVVPGPEPVLALLAIAAVAAMLGRARLRRK